MLVKNRPGVLLNRIFILSYFPVIFISLFLSNIHSYAQENLSKPEQKEIVEMLCSKLEKLYPVSETGKKTSLYILENYKAGKYSGYTSSSEFVQHLNDDLASSSKDGHLGIIYDPVLASELKKEESTGDVGKSYADLTSESERWNNYGFKELKILDGNIGYLNLKTFFSLKYAGETAAAAMRYFSNCNALIIDLRRNGGGWDDMVTFLASYFIDTSDDILLNIERSTEDNSYSASKISAYVPGKKLFNIPVVILTSKSTASAAEAFTNIMRNFSKKTSVVGETTAGAENPVSDIALFGGYLLRIPTWQKVYSFDKTGWEGSGIKPDTEAESERALETAQMSLLNKLKQESKDEALRNKYQWYIEGLNALNNPVSLPGSIMQTYQGKYGNRNIYYENGALFYQYKGRTKRKMLAVSDDFFLIEGTDSFRIKFITVNNKVTGFSEVHNDGNITQLTKE